MKTDIDEAESARLRRTYEIIHLIDAFALAPVVKYLPPFMVEVLEIDARLAGWILGLGSFIAAFGGFVGGRIHDAVQNKRRLATVLQITQVLPTVIMIVITMFWRASFWEPWPWYSKLALFSMFHFISSICGNMYVLFITASVISEGLTWGPVRAMVSIGWGLGTWTGGYLSDLFGPTTFLWTKVYANLTNFTFMLFSFATRKQELLPISASLLTSSSSETTQEEDKWTMKEAFKKCLNDKYRVINLTNLVIMGVFQAFVDQFLYVFLVQRYNVTNEFLGRLTLFMTLMETPVFYYGTELIQLLGLNGLYVMSHLCYVVRVLLYPILPAENLWVLYIIEISHAFTFAGMWVASIDFGIEIGGSSNAGIVQAIIRSIYFNTGTLLGSILCPYIFTKYGWDFMWRISSAVVGFWSVLYNIIYYV